MVENKRIFVAGHRGMVGSAIVRNLQARGEQNLVLRTRQELDLLDQSAVNTFFETEAITHVYMAAAKVGGIHANDTYPAEFIYENLKVQSNIVRGSPSEWCSASPQSGLVLHISKVCRSTNEERKRCSRVSLEPTNEPYAIAKIAGIKLCESYSAPIWPRLS